MKSKYPVMSNERIEELKNFKIKNFSDCPVMTEEELKRLRPRYPEHFKNGKQNEQISLDADILEWFKQTGPSYQTRTNSILRQAMLQAN